jgi:uncharacterized membrane protein
MDIRKLPLGRGFDWFKQTADLGARNPRAVFGAALLLMATLYLIAVAMGVITGGLARPAAGQQPSFERLMLVAVPLFLLLMLLLPVLLGGLMHVIREAEAGRPVRARDLFAPFRQGRAPRLAMLGVVQIGLALLAGAVLVLIAGADYWRDSLAAVRGAMSGSLPVMPEPENRGLMLLAQLVFNYFSYAIMLLSVPLILFSGAGLGAAILASLRAALRNAGPYLLAAVLFVVAMIVAALVVVLLAAFAGLLGNLVHQVVGGLLTAIVFIAFGAVVLVALTGAAYLAWRDSFGDAAAPPVNGIEV